MADDDEDGFEPLFDYGREQAPDDDEAEADECTVTKSSCATQARPSGGERSNSQGTGSKPVAVDDDASEDTSWLPPPPRLAKKVVPGTSLYPVSSLLRAKQAELLSLSRKACEDIDELDRRTRADQTRQSDDKIVVRVQDRSGGIHSIRVGMDDRFDKLFAAYSKAKNMSAASLVFRFDGEQVAGSATPRSINLENDDMLEVFSTPSVANDANLPHQQHHQQHHHQQRKIVLKIQDKSGAINSFRVGLDDRFERLFAAYASSRKACKSNLVFRFDGEELRGDATPESLEMEDEDTIEVFLRS